MILNAIEVLQLTQHELGAKDSSSVAGFLDAAAFGHCDGCTLRSQPGILCEPARAFDRAADSLVFPADHHRLGLLSYPGKHMPCFSLIKSSVAVLLTVCCHGWCGSCFSQQVTCMCTKCQSGVLSCWMLIWHPARQSSWSRLDILCAAII